MASVSVEDALCPRCDQRALYEEYYTKRADHYTRCQDCGYVHDQVLRDEYWEDLRLEQLEAGKRYLDITEFVGAGVVFYATREGPGVFGSLGWDDPHGDRVRLDVHQHNSTRNPSDPDYITEAYVSLYHPGLKRWERTYIETGVSEGYRFRNTLDALEMRPLPWGYAINPPPPKPAQSPTAEELEAYPF